MRMYAERLRLPASWWFLGLLTAVIFATMAWAGFSMFVVIACYVVIVGGCAAALLLMGATTIVVADGELRAARRRLALGQAGQVAALDADQARALRGPRADPAAFMLFRPYLKAGVYVQVIGPDASVPYWLIGTRRPEELAAAIERARPAAHAEGTPVG